MRKAKPLRALVITPVRMSLAFMAGLIFNLVLLFHPLYAELFQFPPGYASNNAPNEADDLNEYDVPTQAYVLPVSKPLGQVSGLGIDSKDNLIVFHRAGRTWDKNSFSAKNKFNSTLEAIRNSTIFVVDRDGDVLREYGGGMFYMPHGLTVDSEDNIWLTDVGRHQVIKMDKNFKVLLELGEKMVPGSDDKHFCMPTDVAVSSNGHFFVADGYCNNRIMKFDQHGELIASFDSEFDVPHSLALIEDLNMICVADRENERIQCFSAGLANGNFVIPSGLAGKPITKAENIGPVYAIREKNHYLIGLTGSDGRDIEPQLFVLDMDSGQANTFAKGIENAHALAIFNDGVVSIGQMNPNRIVQLSLNDQMVEIRD